jgi:hypothetical protein
MRAARTIDAASTSARAAQAAVAWAEAEGWNPGLDDERRFLAADPGSFLATERAGEILATASCVLYGGARSLRAAREMESTFETARMYLNGRPPEDVQRVFGVTTLEFG